MPEEGFLRRWARVKATGAPAEPPEQPAAALQPAAPVPGVPASPAPAAPERAAASDASAPAPQSTLTLDDAARLTPDSDFSAFVSRGVDKDVRRMALKKLFADPHFNVMDRLDMYMDDYNKPDPVSAAMLAGLQHARSVLRTPQEVCEELARLAALDAPARPAEPDAAQGAEDGIAAVADAPAGDTPLPEEGAGDETTPDEPGPVGQHNDAIALTIVRAHNTEAHP